MHTLRHTPSPRSNGGGQSSSRRCPRFSGRDIRLARAFARSTTAPNGTVQRARLALFIYEHPRASDGEVAASLGQSSPWVGKWRRRWAVDGFELEDRFRCGRPWVYSAAERAAVVAVACELPERRDLPLSRHSASSIQEVLEEEGIRMSVRTVQRILADNALKPWRYRSWISPRDPQFESKASVILDLYQGIYLGQPLGEGDQVLSADEKPSIQARERLVRPPCPGQPGHVESDYKRRGALQYLVAWDVRRGIPYGRCERRNGIDAFDRLVEQVMRAEPYRSAPRVFLIVDNGSAHRGQRAKQRLQKRYPNLILIHTPIHASWLNQVEIYFGLIQRKVLTPAAATDLDVLTRRIMDFEARCRCRPKPFRWKFTSKDFRERLRELAAA